MLEKRVGGQVKAQYVWSPVYVDALVLRDRDTNGDATLDERLYVVQDANYNITALFDNAGTIVERYAYDPFGQATVLDTGWNVLSASAFGWLYLHQGGRFDATSGLYHFRHRDYSPTLGCWTRLDPIRYAAGDVNLSRYVFNRPTIATDPTGEIWPLVIVGAIAGWYLLGPGAGTANAPAPGQETYVLPPRPIAEDVVAGLPGAAAGAGAGLLVEGGEAAAVLGAKKARDVIRRGPPGGGTPAPFNPANFIGSQAVTPPHLPAGTHTALVIDGRVYVARFHNIAWELAGRRGNIQFYGFAEIDAAGRVVRLFR